MEIIMKLPIGQLSTDLAEVKKGIQCMKKAIASHKADDENDNIKKLLEPHESKVQERLAADEADIKV